MNAQFLRILWLWLRRDIKSRYAGSVAGLAWAVAGPVATIALFYVLFAFIFRVKVPELASDSGYFYYLLAGILPWLAIADGLGRGSGVIVAYEQFLQKQVFSVSILPLSVVLAAVLPQLIGTLLLVFLLLAGGIVHPLGWLLWPLVFLLQLAMVAGLALGLSVIAVHVRDVVHGLPVVLQFVFYATPILFPMSMVPEEYHRLFLLNPFAPLIRAYQSLFLGIPYPLEQFLALCFWGVVLGLGGWLLFRVMKPTLGEAL